MSVPDDLKNFFSVVFFANKFSFFLLVLFLCICSMHTELCGMRVCTGRVQHCMHTTMPCSQSRTGLAYACYRTV